MDNQKDLQYLFFGRSGVGKSHICGATTGKPDKFPVRPKGGIQSQTKSFQFECHKVNHLMVWVADTPGLDDYRDDKPSSKKETQEHYINIIRLMLSVPDFRKELDRIILVTPLDQFDCLVYDIEFIEEIFGPESLQSVTIIFNDRNNVAEKIGLTTFDKLLEILVNGVYSNYGNFIYEKCKGKGRPKEGFLSERIFLFKYNAKETLEDLKQKANPKEFNITKIPNYLKTKGMVPNLVLSAGRSEKILQQNIENEKESKQGISTLNQILKNVPATILLIGSRSRDMFDKILSQKGFSVTLDRTKLQGLDVAFVAMMTSLFQVILFEHKLGTSIDCHVQHIQKLLGGIAKLPGLTNIDVILLATDEKRANEDVKAAFSLYKSYKWSMVIMVPEPNQVKMVKDSMTVDYIEDQIDTWNCDPVQLTKILHPRQEPITINSLMRLLHEKESEIKKTKARLPDYVPPPAPKLPPAENHSKCLLI